MGLWRPSAASILVVSLLVLQRQAASRAVGNPKQRGAPEEIDRPLLQLLADYSARHLAATSKPDSDGKYVFVREFEYVGLGNNLPGIASAFLFALATNRTLLMDSPNLAYDLDLGPLDFLFDNQVRRWQEWNVQPLDWHNMTWESDMDVWLLSDWSQDPSIAQHRLVALDHEFDYPLAIMQANPYLKLFIQRYFPRGDPFHELSKFLFNLSAPTAAKVDAVRSQHFRRHMIGLQIRRLKGHGDYLPEVESFAHLALAVQDGRGWPDEDTGFFVATDVPDVMDGVRAALAGRAIVYLDKNMTVNFQPSENPGTVVDALVDMKLLSHCDELLITYGSSFGQVAAGLGGLKPYVLLYGSNAEHQQLPRMSQSRPGVFSHQYTSEPCCWHCPKIAASRNETIKFTFRQNRRWLHHQQCHW